MTTDTFLQNFDLLAEAPGGVPKLRELILQLAVRGQLVPQEKGEVHHEGHEEHEGGKEGARIKGPYVVPRGWRWATLRSVSRDLGQKVPDEVFTYIDVSAIDKEHGRIGEEIQVLQPSEAPSRARKLVDVGTVIYSTVRPYLLNIAVVDQKIEPSPIVSTAFFVMQPFDGVSSRYLFYYLRSTPFTAYVNDAMTGMAYPAVNDSKMSVAPFPLPPLPEQKRIVAKVDELMKRCDELEARQNERNDRHKVTVSACLHSLTAPTSSFNLQPSSLPTILHPSTFNLLLTSPASVAELRKTILQLAVQGRLVKQVGKEESMPVFLMTIDKEIHRLRQTGAIRKDYPLPPIQQNKVPFPIPGHWKFVRLGCLMSRIGSGSTPRGGRSTYVTVGVPFLRSQNVWNDGLRLDDVAYITPETHQQMKGTHVVPGDILLNITGASLGRCAVAPPDLKEANVSQHVSILRPILSSMTPFLHLTIMSPQIQHLVWTRQVGMAREGLSKKVMELFEIPVPPLAEQKRIVAKVNELMVLCDALEVKLTQSREDADALATAVVHHICNGWPTRNGK